MVGHSQGEIAAACVAGALSLEDAARVVALRARALAELRGHGAMLSLRVGRAEAERLLRDAASGGLETVASGGLETVAPGALETAAVNGPDAVVVAGDPDAVRRFQEHCAEAGIDARLLPRRLRLPHLPRGTAARRGHRTAGRHHPACGRHPPLLHPCGASSPTAPASTPRTGTRTCGALVEFEDAIGTLGHAGYDAFVEVSPHPVLGASIQATVGDASTVVGSLRRGDDSPGRFLTSVAEAHVGGVAVDWRAVHGDAGPDGTERPDGSYGPVDLPTYAFDHERFWLLPDATGPAPATDAWRYRVGWQETTESLNSADLDGRWLLLVPAAPDGPQAGHAWCDAAAGALAGHGAPPHTVTVPVGDPARGGHRRTRRPRRPARFRRLRGSASRCWRSGRTLDAGAEATLVLLRELAAADTEGPRLAGRRAARSAPAPTTP
ncbi:acyltransferase domain-containing protein [Streptomyces sp. KL116D]|uniref:acyltransferase domain-containing protein n=1 Tax=Streptomyces sp. KL116D TaxID=3045152 RepID=UPI0035563FE8